MLTAIAFLAIGLIILVKGSDIFVESAAKFARLFGISTFVIGMSIVAIGTSLPELASSLLATYYGNQGIAVGNIIGSNIANIALVLALAVILAKKIKVSKSIFDRECILLLAATALFAAFSQDGAITFYEGIFMLAAFAAYTAYLFKIIKRFRDLFDFGLYLRTFYHFGYGLANIFSKNAPSDGTEIGETKKNIVLFIVGLAGVLAGAHLMVQGAISLAELFGVSDEFIGLTLVAVGTSLPEIAVSITSLRKGLLNIVVGNIIGSNIANILLVGGLAALIMPLTFIPALTFLPMLFMAFITMFFAFAIYGDWQFSKGEAIFMLIIYFIFITSLF
ncbi:MAG: calcium/sodium antiporter [Candidatus Diapherotrites archaeon]